MLPLGEVLGDESSDLGVGDLVDRFAVEDHARRIQLQPTKNIPVKLASTINREHHSDAESSPLHARRPPRLSVTSTLFRH